MIVARVLEWLPRPVPRHAGVSSRQYPVLPLGIGGKPRGHHPVEVGTSACGISQLAGCDWLLTKESKVETVGTRSQNSSSLLPRLLATATLKQALPLRAYPCHAHQLKHPDTSKTEDPARLLRPLQGSKGRLPQGLLLASPLPPPPDKSCRLPGNLLPLLSLSCILLVRLSFPFFPFAQGLSLTAFKNACRRLGVSRWPYERRSRLQQAVHAAEGQASPPQEDAMRDCKDEAHEDESEKPDSKDEEPLEESWIQWFVSASESAGLS
eukprot:753571-Hanusia_phi.AAC.1